MHLQLLIMCLTIGVHFNTRKGLFALLHIKKTLIFPNVFDIIIVGKYFVYWALTSATAAPSIPEAILIFLLAIILRVISLMTGEMSMKKITSLLKVKSFISVVSETLWTGLAGIAVSAEYANE